jgi:hypothetical protein
LNLQERLRFHKKHFKTVLTEASRFLLKCQIAKPYVEQGSLYGCVCPWEIVESVEGNAFPILEDFHDTLEAIWVWTFHTKVLGKNDFKPNVDAAWSYVTKNWKRFISKNSTSIGKGLYDCSHLLNTGILYENIFDDKQFRWLMEIAGKNLEVHLSNFPSTKAREYSDPFWMVTCLAHAAKHLEKQKWLETARKYVKKHVVEKTKPFYNIKEEPEHKGPGGHDFFSKNANKALALTACFPSDSFTKQILRESFLPATPHNFVKRHTDEHAWNAHVAAAIGKAFNLTGEEKFLKRYFAIMDILNARVDQGGLPRSPNFPLRESWAVFFYLYAYASIENLSS